MTSIPTQAEQDARWEAWQAKNRARDTHNAERRSRIVKLIAAASLAAVLMFWSAALEYPDVVRAAVTVGALVAALRSYRTGEFIWIVFFMAAVALWNPIIPTFMMAGPFARTFVAATAVLFLVSSTMRPRLLQRVHSGSR